jgi:hypothetical protein
MKYLLSCALLIAACDGADPEIDAGTRADAGQSTQTDAGRDAQTTPSTDAGTRCNTYCECMVRDCAGIQEIPGGQACQTFCASFTDEQYGCRMNHCSLVVPENNPNHCMHAVGMQQCE